MGRYLTRAKLYFGDDTRGLLEGGRYALLHTRTLEFDELRPYVPGDDVRDIDWAATARTGAPLIKRFVTEKHHKIVVVADTGRNMGALAPSGELKRDIAVTVIGAIGLIALRRADQLGMVYGDRRGAATIPARRGENHVEAICDRFYHQTLNPGAGSDIVSQLRSVAAGYTHRMLVVVVSDEPDVTEQLVTAVEALTARHDLLWVMVADMAAVGSSEGELDGYDVATGEFVLNGATLGPQVIAAYQAAEQARRQQLAATMTRLGVRYAVIGSSGQIREKITELTQDFHLTRDFHHAQ